MVEFFRSAMSYLSGEGEGGGSGSGGGSAFVGQTVDVGEGMKLKVKKVVAEGGYGFVFIAQDISTGIDYALKRQIVSSENIKAIKQEITFLTQLAGHPNIIHFITAASSKDPGGGSAEFLIVTELVTGGELVNIVNTQSLSPRQVLRVFYETCQAVAHMHSQTPPIIHRDIKVENLLLSDRGSVKMCDFGSATTQRLSPDHTWSATQRGLTEDEIQCNTTPMYRAPEMIDLYSNNPINEKADIWALGCLLYKLCFQEHPFEDSAKLRILNANYHIPPSDYTYKDFHSIIRACLVVDPNKRPSVDAIIAQLYPIADKLGENFDCPPKEPLIDTTRSQTHSRTSEPETDTAGGGPSINAAAAFQATSQQAQKLFGFMKGGAGSLIKNIKDTSNRVISSVQNPKQKSLDVSYITSRILVMSYPYEEGGPGHPNVLREVSAYLEGTHPSQYLVFNISGEQYDTDQLSGQVVDYEWPHRSMPPLESLVELCRQLDSWLRADFKNVLVIHCKDGIHPTSILTVAYLLFLRALPSPSSSLRLFTARRLPEGQGMEIGPSERRYLNYMMALSRPAPYKPHPYSFKLTSLKLTSVPLYNEARSGCKPFVEVFVDGERVHTSCNKENMDKIKEFTSRDGHVAIPLSVTIYGNVLIVIHHIRSVPLSKSAEMGMSAVKMFKFQFHTGFLSTKMNSLTLERNELDGSAVKKQDKFPSSFKVVLNFTAGERVQNAELAWQNLPHPQATPLTCFSTMEEQGDIFRQFGGTVDDSQRKPPMHQGKPQAPPSQATPSLEGYGQLLDDESSEPATGNLLGVTPPQGGGGNLADFVGYASYRAPGQEGAESSSSSDSSGCSSSSSDSEGEDVPTSSHSSRQAHIAVGDDLEAFFSNPAAGNIEEANLLGLNMEEAEPTPPPVKMASQVSNTSVTSQGRGGVGGGASSSSVNDPFQDWEWNRSGNAPPTATSVPSHQTSGTSFDPFAPSSSGNDMFNLMGGTPLLPSATAALATTPNTSQTGFTSSSQTGFATNFGTSRTGYPSSSGYSGWASFTATSTTSKRDEEKKPMSQGPSSKSSTPLDPFGDIWGQASGKSQSSQAPPMATSTQQQQQKPTMTNRPTYQTYGGRGGMTGGSDGWGNGGVGGTKSGVGGAKSGLGGASSGSGLRPPSRENATRSPSPTHKFGPVPNRGRNQFNDLLDPGLFTTSAKEKEGPTSLKDLSKKKEVITDPEKAKVAEWADGKEHNIRALISSLHTILWEGEKRWKPIGMHELVEADQVSKWFRRACLSVHPDKVDEKNSNLARHIFDELNDAYELFEQSGAKSLYQ